MLEDQNERIGSCASHIFENWRQAIASHRGKEMLQVSERCGSYSIHEFMEVTASFALPLQSVSLESG